METDLRSLLGAFSKTLNQIKPAVQYHHEQTACLSCQIAEEMKLKECFSIDGSGQKVIEPYHMAQYRSANSTIS